MRVTFGTFATADHPDGYTCVVCGTDQRTTRYPLSPYHGPGVRSCRCTPCTVARRSQLLEPIAAPVRLPSCLDTMTAADLRDVGGPTSVNGGRLDTVSRTELLVLRGYVA